jgi:hypothetical protein
VLNYSGCWWRQYAQPSICLYTGLCGQCSCSIISSSLCWCFWFFKCTTLISGYIVFHDFDAIVRSPNIWIWPSNAPGNLKGVN